MNARIALSAAVAVVATLTSLPVAAAQGVMPEDQIWLANGANAGDQVGQAVDARGDVAIVGAPADDDNGVNAGAAYVLRRVGGVWQQEQKLLAQDGSSNDLFGGAVGISGDVAVVGAAGDADQVSNGGATYVFRRVGGVWTQEAKLVPPGIEAGDTTGSAVAIDGDTLITCSDNKANGFDDNTGEAYVYRFGGQSWGLEDTLVASDHGAWDFFAWSVDLRGDVAVLGAIDYDVGNLTNRGAAYVFRRSGSTWSEEAILGPSNGGAHDQFGYSVGLGEDLVVVGANDHDAGASDTGAVYVFRRTGGVWGEQQRLTASDGAAFDRLGTRVAVDGDRIVAQAPLDDDTGTNSGVVFVWREANGTWVEQTKYIGSDTDNSDAFGRGLAITGTTVLASSIAAAVNFGAVYSVDLPDLSLDVQPDTVANAGPLDLVVGGGAPSAPLALVLTGVNGQPTFDLLLVTSLDVDGKWALHLPNAPDFPGVVLDLQAFAEDSQGVLVASREESLAFE